MDSGVGEVLTPAVAMRMEQEPIRADDELARQLPWVIDERSIGPVPRSGQVQAGLKVTSKEVVGRIEQDLCRRPMQQAEGFVRGAIHVAEDRNVQSLEITEACRTFGLALADDDDVASRGPVVSLLMLVRMARSLGPDAAPPFEHGPLSLARHGAIRTRCG